MSNLIKLNIFFSIDFVSIAEYQKVALTYPLHKDQRFFLYGNYRNILHYLTDFEEIPKVLKDFQVLFKSIYIIHLEISDSVVPLELMHINNFATCISSLFSYSDIYRRQSLLCLPFVIRQYSISYFFLSKCLLLFNNTLYSRNLYVSVKSIHSI